MDSKRTPATHAPSVIYVWLVPSEEVLEQPGSWRIRKWGLEPFPEGKAFAVSETPSRTLTRAQIAGCRGLAQRGGRVDDAEIIALCDMALASVSEKPENICNNVYGKLIVTEIPGGGIVSTIKQPNAAGKVPAVETSGDDGGNAEADGRAQPEQSIGPRGNTAEGRDAHLVRSATSADSAQPTPSPAAPVNGESSQSDKQERSQMRLRLMVEIGNGAPNYGLLADAEAEIGRLERELEMKASEVRVLEQGASMLERQLARQLAADSAERSAIPAGWKLVPIDPPEDLLSAMERGRDIQPGDERIGWLEYQRREWAHMLKHVPDAPVSSELENEPMGWAVHHDGEFDYFVYANEQEADDAALINNTEKIPLYRRSQAPASHELPPVGHCSLYIAHGTPCALAGQCLSPSQALLAAAKKIMDRQCTNPGPVGDSACNCCAQHWLTLQAAVGPEGWAQLAPASAKRGSE